MKRASERIEARGKENTEPPVKFTRRSKSAKTELKSDKCFFCDEKGYFSVEKPIKGMSILHRVTTFNRDQTIRECAEQMGDERIIAKLSEGDMVSRDACYHLNYDKVYERISNFFE